MMQEEVFEIIIAELDYYLIEKVREMRLKHQPYLSMLQLSLQLDMPDSTVARAENMKKRDKYNVRTLNKIANFFQLKSYAELFPKRLIKNDLVRMRLQKISLKKGKQRLNTDGGVNDAYLVISITPLTEKEVALWHARKLPYLKIIS
jgi:transcriptional regulator with XRE-family HTH domain